MYSKVRYMFYLIWFFGTHCNVWAIFSNRSSIYICVAERLKIQIISLGLEPLTSAADHWNVSLKLKN